MANITHPHQETSHSVLNAYEQFAQDDLHQGKIVARVNEHKIQIAKMGPQDHPPRILLKMAHRFHSQNKKEGLLSSILRKR